MAWYERGARTVQRECMEQLRVYIGVAFLVPVSQKILSKNESST